MIWKLIAGAGATIAILLPALFTRNYKAMMAKNERLAFTVFELGGQQLKWTRLDDGVMGGRSESRPSITPGGHGLLFEGDINTNGGGFASVRATAAEPILPSGARALRVRVRGDGKQYKLTLSNGQGGGPFSPNPSWQADLPTIAGEETVREFVLDGGFLPSFGGKGIVRPDLAMAPAEMRQVGVMLSLYEASGSPNPAFGSGIFPFRLEVLSIELVA